MTRRKWYRPPKCVLALWRQFKKLLLAIFMAIVMIVGINSYADKCMATANQIWTAKLPPDVQTAFENKPGQVATVNTAVGRLARQVTALSIGMIGVITAAAVFAITVAVILGHKTWVAFLAYVAKATRAAKNIARLYKFFCQRFHAWLLSRQT